jgi:RHS repeat-associated protein
LGDLAYFFGSDDFDNSAGGGFAELEISATVNTGTNDLVSVVTNKVFVPPANEAYAYDADGNQTLVTTGTGAWQVEYNGENRPVRWTCGDKTILMTFDHQGRRRFYVEVTAGVTNKLHRFTYDDYVCIARNREIDVQHGFGSDAFVWDPTEQIATRPLMCNPSTAPPFLYCHDGNKNVSEAVMLDGTIAAHYEYSSFGKVVLVTSENEDQSAAKLNPYRFSSEYADDALGLVYYNYRHYNPADGRWTGRDVDENLSVNMYAILLNANVSGFDVLGAFWSDYIPIINTLHSLFDVVLGNIDGTDVGDYPTIDKKACECKTEVEAEELCRNAVRAFIDMYQAEAISSIAKAKGGEAAAAALSMLLNPPLAAILAVDTLGGAGITAYINSCIMAAGHAAIKACKCD